MSSARQTGKCKWFDRKKGYGFIEVDGTGEDVFVHQSHLRIDGFRALQPEQAVEFVVKPSGPQNKLCATDVTGVAGAQISAGPPPFARRGGRGGIRGGRGGRGRGGYEGHGVEGGFIEGGDEGGYRGRGRGSGRGRGRGGNAEGRPPRAPLNMAFVFIKPHAVTDAVKKLVKEKLEASFLRITAEGSITAEDIDSKKLIDQHYYAIASKATILKPNQLTVPADTFKEKFGVEWADVLKQGLAFNAMDGCKTLGVDGDQMDKMWADCKKNNNLVKLGGGFYCGKLTAPNKDKVPKNSPAAKGPVYVFNGFFMSMRTKFTKKGGSIHYFVVEWPRARLTWADFRGKLLGPTDPAEAPADSLRGIILKQYKELGLKEQPNTGDNGVHASASPFEGLAERMNWLGVNPAEDNYGKLLIEAGISAETLGEWSRDPQVTLGDGSSGSLFDSLEDLDARDCLNKCKEIAKV